MRNLNLKALTILFLLTSFTFSQDYVEKNWSIENANTLKKGRYEFGVFQKLQYGYTDKTEFSTKPLLFLLMPNFEIKHNWSKSKTWTITSSHSASMPTFLLKTISKEGTAGLLPDDAEIPFILSLENLFLATYSGLPRNLSLTFKAGFSFSIRGESDNFPTIDYHLLYPRMADYYEGPTYTFGLSLSGKLGKNLSWLFDEDIFVLSHDIGAIVMEHKLLIGYEFSSTKKILIGYKYSIGEFPYTQNKKLYPDKSDDKFFPVIDFLWAID
jgi:hypothetical protein